MESSIEKKFNNNVSSLVALSLAIGPDGSVGSFEEVAKDVKLSNPGIQTVAILPDGIYKYFYPRTPQHDDILGFNLVKDGEAWFKKRIQDGIESRSPVFMGPFPNVANDSIIITVYPVFIKNKFWGLTMLTNPLRNFIDGVDKVSSKRLHFSISNLNPIEEKEYTFYSSPGQKIIRGEAVKHVEMFSHNNWKITGYYPKPGLLAFMVLPFLLSLCVALAVGGYVNNLIHTPRELQEKVKKTEFELKKYDQRFRSIYENAPIGIAQLEAEKGRITEANKKFCQLAGIDKKNVLGKGLWEFIPPEFYQKAFDEFQDVLAGKSSQLQNYFKHVNQKDRETWLYATVKPIMGIDGQVESHLLVVEDVTDAELARKALETSEEQYRNFFNNSPVALSEYDYSEVKQYLIENNLMKKSFEELYDYFANNTSELKNCVQKIHPRMINSRASELFGFSDKAEFLEKFKNILQVPESWKITIKNFAAVSNEISNTVLEEKITTRDGEEKFINYHWGVMPGHEQEMDRVISTMTDITNVKKSEKEILDAQKKTIESEEKFRTLFEDSPIALWEQDFSELHQYFIEKNLMNKSFDQIFQYFVENKNAFEECFELFRIISVNKQGVNLYDATSKTELLDNVKLLLSSPHSMHYTILALTGLSNGVISSKYETSVNTLSDKIKYIDYQWNVMPGYEKDFGRVIVAMTDITQQKEAEIKVLEASADLKISQERFKSLFYDSPIALWEEDYSGVKSHMISLGIWGSSQKDIKAHFKNNPRHLSECINKIKILSVNREALSIYGTDNVETLREYFMNAANLPESEGVFLMQFAGLGSGKLKLRSESNSVNNKGEMISLDLNWNVLPGHEDNLERVIVSTNDITQIKKSESDLRKAKEDLEHSLNIVSEQNKQLMQFSYIVSHNLRSHAANMQSLSELIIDPDTTAEEKNEYASHLHNITKILSDTMEGLNEVTQIQTSGNLTLKRLNLKTFVRKTIDILSNKITEKNALIHTEIDDDVTVQYYQPYLESVLLCFISNAIKYSSPTRQPLVEIKYSEESGSKILRIKDNGIGIDLEKHGPRMFGLFKTFTSNPDSRGIGLYIAKNQIEAMRGQVAVQSIPDVGTTFEIVFR